MKNIIVCGASKNLGKYISDKFSEQNNVYRVSRSKIEKKNYFSANLSKLIETKKVLNRIKNKAKKIDAIIFCVGNSKKNYLKYANSDNFNQSFNSNFYPFIKMT